MYITFTFTPTPTVAGLPEHFEPPGEQSFASTAANPADSDNDQSNDQSNDTLTVFESESPYTRSPLKRSPGEISVVCCCYFFKLIAFLNSTSNTLEATHPKTVLLLCTL